GPARIAHRRGPFVVAARTRTRRDRVASDQDGHPGRGRHGRRRRAVATPRPRQTDRRGGIARACRRSARGARPQRVGGSAYPLGMAEPVAPALVLARRWFKALDERDGARAAALVSDDCRITNPTGSEDLVGPAGVRELLRMAP